MKRSIKTAVLLLATLCVLVGTFPVAALYTWEEGKLPLAWDHPNHESQIEATNLLAPVNPNASREARNLLAYLSVLSDSDQIISGQFDISNTEKAYNALKEEFGVEPGLYSARYVVDTGESIVGQPDADPSTWDDSVLAFKNMDSTNSLLQKHYENGNILLVHADGVPRTLCAELAMQNKPGEYPYPINAIRELDITNPDRDMQTYAAWVRFQENLVVSLRDLETRGVKAYMYRPWVEFNNYPFSGMNDMGYDAFARVYQQTVQRLIDGGLTGFLIAYSPSCSSDTIRWYPGNEYVDTNAVTIYSDADQLGNLSAKSFEAYDWYVRSGKPLGFAEWSCRTGEYLETDSQARASTFSLLQSVLTYWPKVCWGNFWGDGSYSPTDANGTALGNDDGMLYLHSPYVLTLDELTDYRAGKITAPGVVQLFNSANGAGQYMGLEEKEYSAAALREIGIDLTAVRSLRTNTGYSITFFSGDECTGKAYSFGFTESSISRDMAKNFTSCRVTGKNNVALDQSEIYASVNDDNAWKANDGGFSVWSGDLNSDKNDAKKGTGWMYIDLGAVYEIGRYVIKTAGYANYPESYNLAGYDLEYSVDDQTWIRIDRVADNTLSQIDRHIDPVRAQYFRLVFTDPNRVTGGADIGVVTISEWELFGVDPGARIVANEPEKPTTTTTKKTTKKTTTTTALKLATPKVTVSNATKGVKVSWGKVSKAETYRVYRRLYSSGKWGSWSKIKTTTSVSYTDEGAKTGKNYQYMVKAVKGSVTSGYKASATITRLSVPKVTAANVTKGIKVSWGKVTGATGYRVYRRLYSSGKWGSWSKIKTTSSTAYTDGGAKTGKNYQYMVKAVKGDSTSYYKATATIRRLKAPSSLKLTKATKGFKVSWSKATGATKYEVYRKTGNGSYKKIATTTKTAYTDKTAKKGKYYTYRVRAVYSSSKSVFKTGGKTKR